MHILMVLLYPFRLWQVFSLSPFGLARKTLWPKESTKLKYYAIACILIHIFALIFSFFSISTYTSEKNSVVLRYNTILSLIVSRLLACVIVIEAVFKRNDQIDFFERVKKIDSILKQKLQVKIEYTKYQHQNNFIMFACLFIYLSMEIFVLARVYVQERYFFLNYWLYLSVPNLISSLLCHQIATYVHIIRRRYAMINDFLRKIALMQSRGIVNRGHEKISSFART